MSLEELRGDIDQIDQSILVLFAERMEVAREIAEEKRRSGLEVRQQDRFEKLAAHRVEVGAILGLPEDFVRGVWDHIHELSIQIQEQQQ